MVFFVVYASNCFMLLSRNLKFTRLCTWVSPAKTEALWCRWLVCYGRVLPGRGETPISAQAHDRRPKNPKFNGKTTVDPWELSSQDADLIHCYESPHSRVCIYKVSLIYLYTLIPITIIHKRHNSATQNEHHHRHAQRDNFRFFLQLQSRMSVLTSLAAVD